LTLRLQAAADLRTILEDAATGFGWSITVTDPEGETADLVGASTDISELIDPETGQAVSGRKASVAIALASLAAAGLGIPKAIAERTQRPWLVAFADIGGAPHTFKVSDARPDRAIGCVVCLLEAYRPIG
jgi:hypothetical protein